MGQLTSGMPDIMAKKGGNIKAFNQDIRGIIRRIKCRGTDPGSLLPQLLRVYSTVEDKGGKFTRYIENLNNNYIDGTFPLDDSLLMTKAEAKYEELVEDEQFEVKNAKDDTIIALQAQIEALTVQMSETKKPKKTTNDGNGDRKKKSIAAWMTKPPKEGEPKTKTVDGKTYHWCEGYDSHDPRWVIHQVEQCRGYKKKFGELGSQETTGTTTPASAGVPKSESQKETQRVKWSTTMMASLKNDE
jgi:hypothetical protein